MKARLLIEGFDSAELWGWKDPRNSLTLPFWQKLLPGMKTLIMVRNPLEVAHSMRERNGTSYSFGLRLWEIYNRRLIETASEQERLVTHYDLFFEDPENGIAANCAFHWFARCGSRQRRGAGNRSEDATLISRLST